MLISEIYGPTIQGEGLYVGIPCFFIRTSGCNLRCKWGDNLCDTPYTSWEPTGQDLEPHQIFAQVCLLRDKFPELDEVVISGGEPTLQLKELGILTRLLKANRFRITIETNGTQAFAPGEVEVNLLSISPKLASSTPVKDKFEAMHSRTRINIEALKVLMTSFRSYLKFVIHDSKKDLQEIQEILQATGVKPLEIYLMAEGITSEEVKAQSQSVIEACYKYGYSYTPRLHLDLFGPGRGH